MSAWRRHALADALVQDREIDGATTADNIAIALLMIAVVVGACLVSPAVERAPK